MTSYSLLKPNGAIAEVVTFTPQELDIITDALRVANSHYQSLAETVRPQDSQAYQEFRATFLRQSQDAGELQLKIEAAR